MPRKLTPPPDPQPWERMQRRDGKENLRWDRDVDATLEASRMAREAAWQAYRRRQRWWLAGIVVAMGSLGGVVIQFTGLVDLRTAGPRLWSRAVERFGPVLVQPAAAPTGVLDAAAPDSIDDSTPAAGPRHELPPPTVMGDPLQLSRAIGDGVPGVPVPVRPPEKKTEDPPMAPGTMLYHLYHKSGEKMIDEATR